MPSPEPALKRMVRQLATLCRAGLCSREEAADVIEDVIDSDACTRALADHRGRVKSATRAMLADPRHRNALNRLARND